ncbi:hypothetical protein [Guptibacillus hwajinpoensis]|uniref:hypothetical protein n=1 Tax=Guptibacillus hwajinpoensis TaxID=208199 RepID=UPI001CFD4BE5|nr:hypothetical protein [Pseudalkalibacillus hwajinpoensis]WLR59048.1 hypothetical protein LC071_18140 [Pseudalkalibacillus hwajinpoensis]
MSLKTKVFFLVFFPILLLTLSVLEFSESLNPKTGFIVTLLSALSGLVVNRFKRNKKDTY